MANPGLSRERVTIQSYAGTADGQGGTAPAWTDVKTVWAQVTPTGGGEALVADRVEASVSYTARIRYRSDMADPRDAAKFRLLWRSRPLNIRMATNPDEHRMYLDLACELGVGT